MPVRWMKVSCVGSFSPNTDTQMSLVISGVTEPKFTQFYTMQSIVFPAVKARI